MRGNLPTASDTTPTRANSSWCQGDTFIRYNPKPLEAVETDMNEYDTDETVEQAQTHNARLRAACAEEDD